MDFKNSAVLDQCLNQLNDLLVWIGNDGRLLHANESALAFYGYTLGAFRQLTIHDLDTHFRPNVWPQHWAALVRNNVLTVSVQHKAARGVYRPVEIVDTYQKVDGFEFSIAVIRPIDHRADRSQRMQLMEFSVDQMVDSALWIDKDARIIYANDATCRNLGYAHDELVKLAIYDIDPHFPKKAWPKHWADLQEFKSLTFETEQRHKDGHLVPVEVNANLVQGYEQEFNCAFIRDITDRKAQQLRLQHLANHDVLTNLPNRNLLNERIEHSIALARRHMQNVGVLVIDLDKFKVINDNFGHGAGDTLLQTLAERMLSVVRHSDTVARQGGDEFVIVLDGIEEPGHCARVSVKLLEAIGQPIKFGDHRLEPGASIGIAVWPQDGNDVDTLMKNADIAMYHAKSVGRGNFKFYEEKMGQRVVDHLNLVTGLQRAIKQHEFELFYQPIFDLQDSSLVGAEALIRWQDPFQGMIGPNLFIPTAEESGLIVPIGEWVIQEACRQNVAWLKAGLPAVPIAVNLSARQFYGTDILQTVKDAIAISGLPFSMLRIELTESMLMENPDQVIDVLHAFRAMGLTISIDDFGTGYSSLSYLQQFPVDIIKIDRSFVKDIGESDAEPIIANTIVRLAHSMGYKVLAEGIETEAQRLHLRDESCDLMQGFLLGRPVPAREFEKILQIQPVKVL